jgi:4-oxalmesaconate hydratase
MIIDIHGHYTTAPPALGEWRDRQIAALGDPASAPSPDSLQISDADIAATIEANQLRLMDERGIDVTVFSPRASFMAHHIGDFQTSSTWAAICNELCYRVSTLFPDTVHSRRHAAAVTGRPGGDVPARTGEDRHPIRLRRRQPQPRPQRRPLDVPAPDRPVLVRPVRKDGGLRHPGHDPRLDQLQPGCFHTTGAHYLNADTTAFMQLLQGDLFKPISPGCAS